MILPDNALGVSDADQWHSCPKSFARSMVRHTRGDGDVNEELVAHHSEILAFGSALHDAAVLITANPDAYIDDVVEKVWKVWGPYVGAHRYKELKDDTATVIRRGNEAPNLELIAAEQDMKVPMFVGRSKDEGAAGDEVEGEWYFYRFRIDALYRDRDDPNHYVIRDYKSYRRERFQEEVDDDRQFTAYVFGVKALYGEDARVTIWCDQVKYDEIFSSRADHELVEFVDWMTATIKAVLATPVEEIKEIWKLNQWCRWCPLLVNCQVVKYANDLALADIAYHRGHKDKARELTEDTIALYQEAKQAAKVIEGFTDQVSSFLKNNPGQYAGKEYKETTVKTPKWTARDVVQVVGMEALDKLPLVGKTRISEYLDNPHFTEALMASRKSGGHTRLTEKAIGKGK